MKPCFSSVSFSSSLLFITTLAAIACTHSVKIVAKAPQELTSIRHHVALQIQRQLARSQTNTLQVFSQGYILARNSDNSPPISDSSGGSR